MSGESKGFWSTGDVAQYLGIPESTLRYWTYLGKGPTSFKIGRRRKYRFTDVRQWAESQADEPGQPDSPRRTRTTTAASLRSRSSPRRKTTD
jgi:hypothetical protein